MGQCDGIRVKVERGIGVRGMGGDVTGVEEIGGAGMEVEGVEVEGIGGIGVEVGVDERIEVDVLDLGGKLGVLREEETSFEKMIVQGQVEEKRN